MSCVAKTLVFLCVLIGSHGLGIGNKSSKDADGMERERRDLQAMALIDVTPPKCRVVNETSACLSTCGNKTLDVTYVMTDVNGSGISYTTIYSNGQPSFSKVIERDGVDENGHPAVFWSYSGICCAETMVVTVIDKAGNLGRCPTVIKMVTAPSGGSITTVSLGSVLIVMGLKSMLV